MTGWSGAVAADEAPALQRVQPAVQVQVQVPTLSGDASPAVLIPAHWFAVAGDAPRPAVVLLHGCGGAHDARGALSARMRAYAALLTAQGWHVLIPDSLTPRGETELCTQRNGTRAVTQRERRRDALGALTWLAARAEVDPDRLALLGWSNGGSTVLAATNLAHPEVGPAPRPRAAVAYYPGCVSELQRGYMPSAPLLLQLGAADDWTPAAPCVALATVQRAGATPVQSIVYPEAHHGFDSSVPVRLRPDVPNGVRPGAGVHVGGQPAAREASRAALLSFLKGAFGTESPLPADPGGPERVR